MDLHKLAENAAVAWRRRGSSVDFARRMTWLYADKLPAMGERRERAIGFRYPDPIGCVRLHLRANGGADAFIHSEVFEHQYYRLPLRSAPATILDLGANIGLATVYFARMFPRAALACVEPAPENLRLLRDNLALNVSAPQSSRRRSLCRSNARACSQRPRLRAQNPRYAGIGVRADACGPGHQRANHSALPGVGSHRPAQGRHRRP
jgi:hypothetical protein